MHAWVALYSGESRQSAKLIALTSDMDVARKVASHVLASMGEPDDPVIRAVEEGRKNALRLMAEPSVGGGKS